MISSTKKVAENSSCIVRGQYDPLADGLFKKKLYAIPKDLDPQTAYTIQRASRDHLSNCLFKVEVAQTYKARAKLEVLKRKVEKGNPEDLPSEIELMEAVQRVKDEEESNSA